MWPLPCFLMAIALAFSAFSMNDEEFSYLPGTLAKKYKIPPGSSSGQGWHFRDMIVNEQNYPSCKISFKRPYKYDTKQVGPHKKISIDFFLGNYGQAAIEIEAIQQDKKPVYNRFVVEMSNDPKKFDKSQKILEVLYSLRLISNNVYKFVIDELNIPDTRLANHRLVIRRIAQIFDGLFNYDDFKKAAHQEFVDEHEFYESFIMKVNEEIGPKTWTNDAFILYFLDEYYLSTLRPHNLALLIAGINNKIPLRATINWPQIIQEELALIVAPEERELATFNLIKYIDEHVKPRPEYLVFICNLINKDSQYYSDVLKIKGAIKFVMHEKEPKKRYKALLEEHLLSGKNLDNLVKEFVFNGDTKGLPDELKNVNLSHQCLINLLDYIRKQETAIRIANK